MDTIAGDAPDGLSSSNEPWGGLLASAGPRDHIVQLYQDQQFLNRAVCRFAAGAIANGEGVILVPTAAHWEAFQPRLEAEGVDVKAAQGKGQLTIVDADELLPPHFPTPIGVFRSVEMASYEHGVADQIHQEVAKKGPGDLAKLIHSGDIWTVHADHTIS